jgi:hypothetical protein
MMSVQDQFSFFPAVPVVVTKKPVAKPPIAFKMTEAEAISLFDEWWAKHCWHREAKGAARRAFIRAISQSATFQQLCDGADRYAAFLKRNPSRPPKHPATWLNASCWEDEYVDDRGGAERARSSAHLGAAHLFRGRAGLR